MGTGSIPELVVQVLPDSKGKMGKVRSPKEGINVDVCVRQDLAEDNTPYPFLKEDPSLYMNLLYFDIISYEFPVALEVQF